MYNKQIIYLRDYKEFTQEEVANYLGVKRSTYQNWERGIAMIPLLMADKLSILYKTSLSYILGISNKFETNIKIKELNYEYLLNKLNELKKENKYTYEYLAKKLNVNRSTCERYFTGKIIIPIDRLISLSKIFSINIDKLCGKL